ncbi:hypothetical protein P3339_23200 [Microbulbifer sp. MLAF003]|uniref:hypothetical protein n=1 Tax=unclassified Microbulbifer TaxID=2619833 RepID=UPI0024ACF144|nr:hypothetical protein [Microbulbifer sp. MLAF003]WHI51267.1 hypothetical protein P3339_23200 [Microbulbifer sp. MLAF003]
MYTIENAEVSRGCYVHPEISFSEAQVPQSVFDIPGMVSVAERKLLYSLASKNYKKHGFIIDAGSFMGASVVSLAQGFLNNPEIDSKKHTNILNRKPISSYELGFLPKPANGTDRVWECGSLTYQFGDSFVPILEESVSPYSSLVDLNIGDFNEFSWSEDPIEICFIDVCKTKELNKHVSKQFMPKLIENKSFFINQDFFFDRLPWIKVTMGYLDKYFEWYGQVFSSSIYKCKKSIPKEVAEYDPFIEATLDECLKLHDMHPNEHLSDSYKLRMSLSRSYLIAMKGRKDDALDYLKDIEKEYEHIMDENTSVDRNDRFRFNRTVRQIKAGIL